MSNRMIAGLLLILGMAASGCSNKQRIPSGILSREKMQDVMWDMIQADQYSSYLAKDSSHIDIKLERLRLYEQVFQLHGVSRDEFKKSYDYYMTHPELTQKLFDSLLSKGNRLRSEAYSHPSVHAPGPDTAHKSPVRPPLQPIFKQLIPNGVHPPPSAGHPAPNAGYPASNSGRIPPNGDRPPRGSGHPQPDTGQSSLHPGTKRPVP